MIRALILAVLLAGCKLAPDPQSPNKPEGVVLLSTYTDEFTGCQYIGQRNSSAGIAPRIGADGKTHMGCKAVAP